MLSFVQLIIVCHKVLAAPVIAVLGSLPFNIKKYIYIICFCFFSEMFDLLVCFGLWPCDTSQTCSVDVQYSDHGWKSVSILSE